MQKAHEFMVSILKSSGDTMEVIGEKAGVSKSTVSRLLSGQPINTDSLHRLASAYGQLDQVRSLQSAESDPRRAAEELLEMYRRSEQMLVDNYEERISMMEIAHEKEIDILTKTHSAEIAALTRAHEQEIAALNASGEKVAQAYATASSAYHRRSQLFSQLFGIVVIICLLFTIVLACYVHYDLTHLESGHFHTGLLRTYIMRTAVRMSMLLS